MPRRRAGGGTSPAPEEPTKIELAPFEGHDVSASSVSIRNTGDGLSKAMTVNATELHKGDVVYVVLECETEKIRFDPIPKTDDWERVHMLVAGRATIVDREAVDKALDDQQERIEKAQGVHRLPFESDGAASNGEGDGDEADAAVVLQRQHDAGVHADGGPREGCPSCDEELAAAAAEAREES